MKIATTAMKMFEKRFFSISCHRTFHLLQE